MRSEEINWLEDPYESTSYDATVKEEQRFVQEALNGLQSQWGEAADFVRDKKQLDQWWSLEESERAERERLNKSASFRGGMGLGHFEERKESSRERIKWKRHQGIPLFAVDDGGDLSTLDIEIVRGGVSVNGFIGALAAVAGREQLLRKIIVYDELSTTGLCAFRFFKLGKWRTVKVDNYLPCVTKSNILLSAQSANSEELWPSLIEKAYAKIHGSYATLKRDMNCPASKALMELTGTLVTTKKIDLLYEDEEELWDNLSEQLNNGNLICCCHDSAEDGEGFTRSSLKGIIPDICYTLAGLVELEDDTRLVKLDNPWGEAGNWYGAWGNDSGEWDLDLELKLKEQLGVFDGDTSTFYMCIEDFMFIFNTVHVCHFQLANWNQITISGAWYDTTSGGPPPVSDEDATNWLLNPRYLLTIENPGKDEKCCITMSLLNDQAGCYSGHTVQAATAGLLIFAGEMNSFSQFTKPVVHIEPTEADDISAMFNIKNNVNKFTIVPYASTQDFEGLFTLQIYSESNMTYRRMPSMHYLNIRGSWVRQLSGGGRNQPTWGCNPQYLVKTRRNTEAIITLKQSGAKIGGEHVLNSFGAIVAQPEKEYLESFERCSLLLEKKEIVAKSEFASKPMIQFLHTFDTKIEDQVIILSLSPPPQDTQYTLNILSSSPLILYPIPHMHTVTYSGYFNEDNSGGHSDNADWYKNPRYLLDIRVGGKYKVVMKKVGRAWGASPAQDSMIGFYVLKSEKRSRAKREQILAESTFLPMNQVEATYQLQANSQYHIMPVTYAPKVRGKYKIQVESEHEFVFNGRHGKTK
ncbi:calpain cysteine protease [Chloropicon primus]|nr:calpain cysteine protease [Chloropicon primus]